MKLQKNIAIILCFLSTFFIWSCNDDSNTLNETDLIILNASVEPLTAGVAETVSISYQIYNAGESTTTEFENWYYLSTDNKFDLGEDKFLFMNGNNIAKTSVSGIEYDGYEWVEEDIIVSHYSDDANYILIVADKKDILKESNEDNNIKAIPFTVNGTSFSSLNYCASDFSDPGHNDYISYIDALNIYCSSSYEGYADFTNIVVDLYSGNTYYLIVTIIAYSTNTDYIGAWIDFNQDGDFDDQNEKLIFTFDYVTGSSSFRADYYVPSDTPIGPTRMRITIKRDEAPTSCENAIYGETEDYTVVVY